MAEMLVHFIEREEARHPVDKAISDALTPLQKVKAVVAQIHQATYAIVSAAYTADHWGSEIEPLSSKWRQANGGVWLCGCSSSMPPTAARQVLKSWRRLSVRWASGRPRHLDVGEDCRARCGGRPWRLAFDIDVEPDGAPFDGEWAVVLREPERERVIVRPYDDPSMCEVFLGAGEVEAAARAVLR